jgi:WD40 repeat protein
MLLLLLLISSGCDVNIPGCGKRSLPFFKQVASAPATAVPAEESADITASITPAAEGQSPAEQPASEPEEMSLSFAKPAVVATFTFTPTATPWEIERIAYTTIEKGKPTLWTMNPDGTDRWRMTKVGTGSYWPLWSPNGKWLLFLSDMKDGQLNLFVAKKGSLEFQQLTQFSDMAPADFIAGITAGVKVVGVGTAVPANKRITWLVPGDFGALKPPFSWSPRSDEVAFAYHNQVWKVKVRMESSNPDTVVSPETLITLDAAYSVSAIEWAPKRDNKHVAFVVKKGATFSSLMLVNPRLRDTLTLAETRNSILDISWSPDTRRVAYVSADNTIFTASSDTSLPKPLIVAASSKLGPLVAYSPVEGSTALITLAKKKKTDDGLCVALLEKPSAEEPDPGTFKYLTEQGVSNAVWSPDGSKIAYTQSGDLWIMDALSGANKKLIAKTGIQCPNWSKK